jgi:hypothetical protein
MQNLQAVNFEQLKIQKAGELESWRTGEHTLLGSGSE